MFFSIGEIVSRNSYNNDILFKIKEIHEDIAILEGIDLRLIADSDITDLKKEERNNEEDDISNIIEDTNLERDSYFFLPGKILHLDSDDNYLKRCLKLYKKMNIMAYGVVLNEEEMPYKVNEYVEKIKPNIVVVTGHDALLNSKKYKNSDNFIKTIEKIRSYESSQEKIIIIAGACQSNYEELIKAGANFASSPKRINIHALDPAIIASKVALSEKNKPINLLKIINSTKYKENGFGGIITNGTMYRGYPR